MGNCCGSNPNNYPVVVREYKHEKYILPRIILISQDSALIYLDVSWTSASNRLKHSLKRRFPNLVSCDHEKQIFNQIKMINERKYYIIIAGNIREGTILSLLASSKVKAIYFCLDEMNLGQYRNSSKIKGFFTNQIELEEAIYYDVRCE